MGWQTDCHGSEADVLLSVMLERDSSLVRLRNHNKLPPNACSLSKINRYEY